MQRLKQGQSPQERAKETVPRLIPIKARGTLADWRVGPRYVPRKYIGKGSYATVAEAVDSESGEKVAIKRFSKVFRSAEFSLRVLREVLLLKHLKHPCIIKSFDVIISGEREQFDTVYLVLQHFPMDLKQLLQSSCYLTERVVVAITYQLITAVKYLQSSRVLHRDLKPQNVLVNGTRVKLCDFSLARPIGSLALAEPQPVSGELKRLGPQLLGPPPKKKAKFTQHVVTRWYRAPELILRQSDYDSLIDVWSVGCIFGQLLRMIRENCPDHSQRRPIFPGGACYPFSPPSKQISYVQQNGFPHSTHDQLYKVHQLSDIRSSGHP